MLYFINTCFLCCITQSRKVVLTIESHTIPAYWNIRDGHKHQIYYRNLSPTHITSKGTYIESNKHAVEITWWNACFMFSWAIQQMFQIKKQPCVNLSSKGLLALRQRDQNPTFSAQKQLKCFCKGFQNIKSRF